MSLDEATSISVRLSSPSIIGDVSISTPPPALSGPKEDGVEREIKENALSQFRNSSRVSAQQTPRADERVRA
jgi:hypothetical protein